MRIADMGALPLTIIASLTIAATILIVRIFVLMRMHHRRQRENRQETERLKSLVTAYRSLAGSFSPATGEHRPQLEEALSDIVLFGSLRQVEMAAGCARSLTQPGPSPGPVDYQPLVEDLRADLRLQLGLEPIPPTLPIPLSGPGRVLLRPQGRGAGGQGKGGASNHGSAAAPAPTSLLPRDDVD